MSKFLTESECGHVDMWTLHPPVFRAPRKKVSTISVSRKGRNAVTCIYIKENTFRDKLYTSSWCPHANTGGRVSTCPHVHTHGKW